MERTKSYSETMKMSLAESPHTSDVPTRLSRLTAPHLHVAPATHRGATVEEKEKDDLRKESTHSTLRPKAPMAPCGYERCAA